ncbi:MAG: BadF/BadG/BcrA/BcrD ATPase family protein [Terriglobales bacterium]
MVLFAGLDGGGTKTQIWIGGIQGPALAELTVGPSSLSRASQASVQAVLADGLRVGLRRCGGESAAVRAICAGFASAGTNGGVYLALLRELAPQAQVRVMPDAELAWYAATGGEDGIVVISGTGSIVWGHYNGRTLRVGGDGPGRDPGSGDAIGRAAVAAGLLPTPPTQDFAALVPELAARPSETTVFWQQAGRDLAAQVRQCALGLAWPRPRVYFLGGVLENAPAVLRSLQCELGEPLLPVQQRPAHAALVLARELVT